MIARTFEEIGISIRRNRGQQRADCPQCGSTKKPVSVDVDNGLWHCHRCGWSGRIGGTVANQADAIERARKADAERARARDAAAFTAQAMWNSAARPMWHPYLKSHGVLPLGIRQRNRQLIVPLFDIDGKLWNVQTIDPDGRKLFLRGGRTTGLYCPIPGTGETIYICEGWATGAALHLYFRPHARVAVAFNCGNLLNVAAALRKKHPGTPLVIAADNDQWTEGNPGLKHGRLAAAAVGGRCIYPNFEGFDTSTRPTDFADLHLLQREARR